MGTHYFSATHVTPLTPRVYSQGCGPVPDALLLKNSGSAGNRTRTSGPTAKNSDHETTEVIQTDMLPLLIE
jgi:hypothetical protein